MRGQRKERKRTPVKQQRIIASLREAIVSGAHPPGQQLPTREVLEKRYRVSRVTIQRVLDRLTADGLTYARGRNGTFVHERPPHLHRYGLLFPWRPARDGRWSRLWQALRNEAEALGNEPDRSIAIYYGPQNPPDESFARLHYDIRAHRLAGLIFASAPGNLRGTPVLEHPGLPRAAIMPCQDLAGVAAVDLPPESMLTRAVEHLQQRGRRRVAVLLGKHSSSVCEFLENQLCERGFEHRPYWLQRVHPDLPEAAREVAHLIFHANPSERPDALIVADDNLVEYAVAGLLAAGLRVPEDVEVVAHCNFPWPAPSPIPLKRVGFDARETLLACIEQADLQRRGEFPKEVRCIEARFEDELQRQDASYVHTLQSVHIGQDILPEARCE
jgi:DNA-binding LacI/PurR family transcriptional regulator